MSISSEITRLQNAKISLKTAINNKNDSSHQITTETLEDYSGFVDSISSSGNIVNGIIEQYKAETNTIDANTFVEFVNNTTIETIGTDTLLSDGRYAYDNAVATLLNKNKVFIAHRNGSNFYGLVCEINGTTITTGTDTILSIGNNSDDYASAVTLSENKVFISHRTGNNLYGIVCEINGTTITTGTDTLISTDTNSYYSFSTKINSSKVFIAHRSGSKLYGTICEISGTTITISTDTQLANIGVDNIQAVTLNENKVFISYNLSSSLRGLVCEINGTTITAGDSTIIKNSSYAASQYSLARLNDNKIFIAHVDTSNYVLYGLICEISGTTITAGTGTQLINRANNGRFLSACSLNSRKVFIFHPYGGSTANLMYFPYGLMCEINGTTIVVGTDTQIKASNNLTSKSYTIKLDYNKAFSLHREGEDALNGVVCLTSSIVKEANDRIDGLTKEECTTSTAGDVWVLE